MDILQRFPLEPGTVVRAARLQEADKIAQLFVAALEDHGSNSIKVRRDPAATAAICAYVAEYIQPDDGQAATMVVDVEGELAGFVFLEMKTALPWEIKTQSAWVHELYLLPQFRSNRRSMGLIRAAIEWAKANGADRIEGGTHHINKGVFRRLCKVVYSVFRMEV